MIGRNRHRGTVGLEFAISSAVVFFLINALVDYGVLFADKHAINYAVVKAARYAALHSATATTANLTSIFNAIVTPVFGSCTAPACSFSVSYPSGNTVGATVVVSATYNWTSTIAHDRLPGVTITSSQTLIVEH